MKIVLLDENDQIINEIKLDQEIAYKLMIQAAEKQISLNQHILDILANKENIMLQ